MQLDDEMRLRHMLDAARAAVRFARNRNRSDLDTDELSAHGLVRLIEIVGEAASRVSREMQAEIPELPWPAIVGMRNRLVHGYYDVDRGLVWFTLTHDLPPLIDALEHYLGDSGA